MKNINFIVSSLILLCPILTFGQCPFSPAELAGEHIFPYANSGLNVRDYYDPIGNVNYHDNIMRVRVYYHDENNPVISKPIVLLGGFDPDCGYNCQAYYNTLEKGDELRALGYDIIIARFNNFHHPIQANAMLVVSLLEYFNDPVRKVGNEPFVVIGASMGGLIGRYALTWMESQNLNHNTRLFVSLDAPQKGANMPLSLQAMLRAYILGGVIDNSLARQETVLVCPSVRQMLRYHILNWNSSNHTISTDPYHLSLFSELKNMNSCNGFPRKTRNIGIALGSLNGSLQKKVSGADALAGEIAFDFKKCNTIGGLGCDNFWDWVFGGSCDLEACVPYGYARLAPTTNSGEVKVFEGVPFASDGYPIAPIKPMDNCPGGYYPWFLQAAEGVKMAFDDDENDPNDNIDMNLNIENGTFIPTVSALAYNTEDYFYNIMADGEALATAKTPFDRIWFDNTENIEHINNLPDRLTDFIYNEIIDNIPKNNPTPNNLPPCINDRLDITNLNLAPTSQDLNPIKEYRAYESININNSSVASGAELKLYAGHHVNVGNTVNIAQGGKLDVKIMPCSKCHSQLYGEPVIAYRGNCGGPPNFITIYYFRVANYYDFPADAQFTWVIGNNAYSGREISLIGGGTVTMTPTVTITSPTHIGSVSASHTYEFFNCVIIGKQGVFETSEDDINTTDEFRPVLEVLPNPGSGQFYMRTTVPEDKTIKFSVMNSMGKIVYTKENIGSETNLNLEHLSSGIYVFIIDSGKVHLSERVVIEK